MCPEMPLTSDRMSWLENYLSQRVDGDWEHQHGIRIFTLDNPGWRVKVSLPDTEGPRPAFERIEFEASESDWYHCWVDEEQREFNGAGGVSNLVSIIDILRAYLHN